MTGSSSGHACFITVFTPTYNRAHTLPRVYESLKKQTFTDFEWLIIDDGSTDNTRELVDQWQAETPFPISYHYQENRGKHIAHNHALIKAQGYFFTVLDSDDEILEDALQTMVDYWNSIPEQDKSRFSGVAGLCVYQDGSIVGQKFPQDKMESNLLEMRFRYKVGGEKWGMHRTELLREIPFPELKIRYLPESYVWIKLSRQYSFLYFNKPLRIYHTTEQSLMNITQYAKMAPSAVLQHSIVLDEQLDYFWYAPKEFLRSGVHYCRFSLHQGSSLIQQYKGLNTWAGRLLWLVALPVGFLVYLKDNKQQSA